MKNDELMHYGRKGMKWYQSIFGDKKTSGGSKNTKKKSSTSDKDESATKKKTAVKSKSETTNTKPKKKSVKEMTNEELQAEINRRQLEQRYSQLNPEPVSLGKRFVNSVTKDVLLPAIKDGSKQLLIEQIKNAGNEFIKSQTKKKN